MYSATNYKFANDTFENLCEHNAKVAYSYEKFSTFKDWLVIKAIYTERHKEFLTDSRSTNMSNSASAPNLADSLLLNNLPQARRASDISASYENPTFNESITHDVDHLADDLLNKFFIEDDEDSAIIPSDIIEFNEFNDIFEDYINEKSSSHIENIALVTDLSLAAPMSPENPEQNENSANNPLMKEFRLNINPKYYQTEHPKLNFDKHFRDTLFMYIEEQNDLPTTMTMFLIVKNTGKFSEKMIDELHLNEWFFQYIELLSKFELWNIRVEVIKSYETDLRKSTTQNSITYSAMCATCKDPIKPKKFNCTKCKRNLFLCSFCHLPVHSLYTWCHLCFHGGHLNHLQDWFKRYNKCPTGCGCNCWNNNN